MGRGFMMRGLQDELGMDTAQVIHLKEVELKGSVSRQKPKTPLLTDGSNSPRPGRYSYNSTYLGPPHPEIWRPIAEMALLALLTEGIGILAGELAATSDALLPAVRALNQQKWIKILHKSHSWSKVAATDSEVAGIVSKVMSEGAEMPWGNAAMGSSSKVLQYGGEIVQVTTNQVAGQTVVSNAWVITNPVFKWQALKIFSAVK